MDTALSLIANLAAVANVAWVLAAVGIRSLRFDGREPQRWVLALFFELRPFYWPTVAIVTFQGILEVGGGFGHTLMRLFTLLISIGAWFSLKDVGGDDDRWKRRGRKVAEKVAAVGHKLVVVPTGN